jgi:hypothetical protein
MKKNKINISKLIWISSNKNPLRRPNKDTHKGNADLSQDDIDP